MHPGRVDSKMLLWHANICSLGWYKLVITNEQSVIGNLAPEGPTYQIPKSFSRLLGETGVASPHFRRLKSVLLHLCHRRQAHNYHSPYIQSLFPDCIHWPFKVFLRTRPDGMCGTDKQLSKQTLLTISLVRISFGIPALRMTWNSVHVTPSAEMLWGCITLGYW